MGRRLGTSRYKLWTATNLNTKTIDPGFFKERVQRGGAEKRERENPKQAPCPVWTPTQGSISQP